MRRLWNLLIIVILLHRVSGSRQPPSPPLHVPLGAHDGACRAGIAPSLSSRLPRCVHRSTDNIGSRPPTKQHRQISAQSSHVQPQKRGWQWVTTEPKTHQYYDVSEWEVFKSWLEEAGRIRKKLRPEPWRRWKFWKRRGWRSMFKLPPIPGDVRQGFPHWRELEPLEVPNAKENLPRVFRNTHWSFPGAPKETIRQMVWFQLPDDMKQFAIARELQYGADMMIAELARTDLLPGGGQLYKDRAKFLEEEQLRLFDKSVIRKASILAARRAEELGGPLRRSWEVATVSDRLAGWTTAVRVEHEGSALEAKLRPIFREQSLTSGAVIDLPINLHIDHSQRVPERGSGLETPPYVDSPPRTGLETTTGELAVEPKQAPIVGEPLDEPPRLPQLPKNSFVPHNWQIAPERFVGLDDAEALKSKVRHFEQWDLVKVNQASRTMLKHMHWDELSFQFQELATSRQMRIRCLYALYKLWRSHESVLLIRRHYASYITALFNVQSKTFSEELLKKADINAAQRIRDLGVDFHGLSWQSLGEARVLEQAKIIKALDHADAMVHYVLYHMTDGGKAWSDFQIPERLKPKAPAQAAGLKTTDHDTQSRSGHSHAQPGSPGVSSEDGPKRPHAGAAPKQLETPSIKFPIVPRTAEQLPAGLAVFQEVSDRYPPVRVMEAMSRMDYYELPQPIRELAMRRQIRIRANAFLAQAHSRLGNSEHVTLFKDRYLQLQKEQMRLWSFRARSMADTEASVTLLPSDGRTSSRLATAELDDLSPSGLRKAVNEVETMLPKVHQQELDLLHSVKDIWDFQLPARLGNNIARPDQLPRPPPSPEAPRGQPHGPTVESQPRSIFGSEPQPLSPHGALPTRPASLMAHPEAVESLPQLDGAVESNLQALARKPTWWRIKLAQKRQDWRPRRAWSPGWPDMNSREWWKESPEWLVANRKPRPPRSVHLSGSLDNYLAIPPEHAIEGSIPPEPGHTRKMTTRWRSEVSKSPPDWLGRKDPLPPLTAHTRQRQTLAFRQWGELAGPRVKAVGPNEPLLKWEHWTFPGPGHYLSDKLRDRRFLSDERRESQIAEMKQWSKDFSDKFPHLDGPKKPQPKRPDPKKPDRWRRWRFWNWELWQDILRSLGIKKKPQQPRPKIQGFLKRPPGPPAKPYRAPNRAPNKNWFTSPRSESSLSIPSLNEAQLAGIEEWRLNIPHGGYPSGPPTPPGSVFEFPQTPEITTPGEWVDLPPLFEGDRPRRIERHQRLPQVDGPGTARPGMAPEKPPRPWRFWKFWEWGLWQKMAQFFRASKPWREKAGGLKPKAPPEPAGVKVTGLEQHGKAAAPHTPLHETMPKSPPESLYAPRTHALSRQGESAWKESSLQSPRRPALPAKAPATAPPPRLAVLTRKQMIDDLRKEWRTRPEKYEKTVSDEFLSDEETSRLRKAYKPLKAPRRPNSDIDHPSFERLSNTPKTPPTSLHAPPAHMDRPGWAAGSPGDPAASLGHQLDGAAWSTPEYVPGRVLGWRERIKPMMNPLKAPWINVLDWRWWTRTMYSQVPYYWATMNDRFSSRGYSTDSSSRVYSTDSSSFGPQSSVEELPLTESSSSSLKSGAFKQSVPGWRKRLWSPGLKGTRQPLWIGGKDWRQWFKKMTLQRQRYGSSSPDFVYSRDSSPYSGRSPPEEYFMSGPYVDKKPPIDPHLHVGEPGEYPFPKMHPPNHPMEPPKSPIKAMGDSPTLPFKPPPRMPQIVNRPPIIVNPLAPEGLPKVVAEPALPLFKPSPPMPQIVNRPPIIVDPLAPEGLPKAVAAALPPFKPSPPMPQIVNRPPIIVNPLAPEGLPKVVAGPAYPPRKPQPPIENALPDIKIKPATPFVDPPAPLERIIGKPLKSHNAPLNMQDKGKGKAVARPIDPPTVLPKVVAEQPAPPAGDPLAPVPEAGAKLPTTPVEAPPPQPPPVELPEAPSNKGKSSPGKGKNPNGIQPGLPSVQKAPKKFPKLSDPKSWFPKLPKIDLGLRKATAASSEKIANTIGVKLTARITRGLQKSLGKAAAKFGARIIAKATIGFAAARMFASVVLKVLDFLNPVFIVADIIQTPFMIADMVTNAVPHTFGKCDISQNVCILESLKSYSCSGHHPCEVDGAVCGHRPISPHKTVCNWDKFAFWTKMTGMTSMQQMWREHSATVNQRRARRDMENLEELKRDFAICTGGHCHKLEKAINHYKKKLQKHAAWSDMYTKPSWAKKAKRLWHKAEKWAKHHVIYWQKKVEKWEKKVKEKEEKRHGKPNWKLRRAKRMLKYRQKNLKIAMKKLKKKIAKAEKYTIKADPFGMVNSWAETTHMTEEQKMDFIRSLTADSKKTEPQKTLSDTPKPDTPKTKIRKRSLEDNPAGDEYWSTFHQSVHVHVGSLSHPSIVGNSSAFRPMDRSQILSMVEKDPRYFAERPSKVLMSETNWIGTMAVALAIDWVVVSAVVGLFYRRSICAWIRRHGWRGPRASADSDEA